MLRNFDGTSKLPSINPVEIDSSLGASDEKVVLARMNTKSTESSLINAELGHRSSDQFVSSYLDWGKRYSIGRGSNQHPELIARVETAFVVINVKRSIEQKRFLILNSLMEIPLRFVFKDFDLHR